MKCQSVITALLISFTATIYAQDNNKDLVPYNEDENKIIYQDVVEVNGVDKGDLFDRFDEWGAKFYRNYNGKVENRDKDAKPPVIELDGWADLEYPNLENQRIKYELEVKFKDNRYRYSLHKLHIDKGYFFGLEEWIEPNQGSKEKLAEKLKTLDKKMNKIIDDMKGYIANPPEEEESDW